MAKTFVLSRTNPSYIKSPFSIKKGGEEGFYNFSGGVILTFNKKNIRVSSINSKTSAEEEKEFFLNIRSEPLSNEIKEVSILNETELSSKRSESDDILNIYIPIAKVNSQNQILESAPFNSNFVYLKHGSEKRMSGAYDNGMLYLSSFLASSPDNNPIYLFKNQEIEISENEILYLNFSGTVQNISFDDQTSDYDIFLLDNIGLDVGNSTAAAIQSDSYTINDNTSTRSKREYAFSFSYPIGVVSSYNFHAFARGNVVLSLSHKDFSYFLETKEDSPNCFSDVIETKRIYTIEPVFE